jgi:hypothetical protein
LADFWRTSIRASGRPILAEKIARKPNTIIEGSYEIYYQAHIQQRLESPAARLPEIQT